MIVSAQGLKDKARNVSIEKSVTIQEVMQNYMFERLLERLSNSKYKQNIILKGGLLLSSIVGMDFRTTMDMDTYLKSIPLTEENLIEIINEIINVKIDDNVVFELLNDVPIRQQDEYGGYRFNLIAILENLKINLSIDIATGDVITPKEITYFYPLMFEDRKLPIFSYNVETIIAEKLQAVVSLGGLNSRMKDFYDLYFLFIKKEEYFSNQLASEAIKATFKRRNMKVEDILDTIDKLYDNEFMNKHWNNYREKYDFISKREFKEVLDVIIDGVRRLEI